MAWSVICWDIARVGIIIFLRAAGEWKYSPQVQCPKILHDKPLDKLLCNNITMMFRCHLAVVHHSHRP